MVKLLLRSACALIALASAPSAFAAAPSLLAPNFGTAVLNFDVGSGTSLGTFASGGGLSEADGATFGPDGNLYVDSGGSPSSILRYDGTTGAFLNTFATAACASFGAPAFGPDGNLYIGCSGGSVRRINGATGADLGVFVPSPGGQSLDFGGLAFNGGSLFVTYVGGTLYQYNASTGALVAELYNGFSSNGPRAPLFLPDGSMLVPEWQTHNVKKFAATTYAFAGNFISDSAATPQSLAIAPNGNLLVLNDPGTSDTVREYNISTGGFLSTLVSAGSGGLSRASQILVAPTSPCAVTAPLNGTLGSCPGSLASGQSCQLACNAGYNLGGTATSCSFGVLAAQTCTLSAAPAPASGFWGSVFLAAILGALGLLYAKRTAV